MKLGFKKRKVATDQEELATASPLAKRKYELLEKESVRNLFGGFEEVYRIRALIDIPLHGVKAGDLGGYVKNGLALSHEGSCWVGGDAIAFGRLASQYESHAYGVDEDALVTDNALTTRRIYGSAKISGNTYVTVSLGGNSSVSGNARITDSDISHSIIVSDNVNISGVRIYGSSQKPIVIAGDIKITGIGDKRMFIAPGSTEINIRGNATLNNVSIGGRFIFDSDTNLENVSFSGDNTILGKPQIKPDAKFTGKNVISGDSIIPPSSHVHDVQMNTGIIKDGIPQSFNQYPADNTLTSIEPSTPSTTAIAYDINAPIHIPSDSSEIIDCTETIEQIEAEYNTYTSDIVKLIRYPAMVDASVPEVAQFLSTLRATKRSLKRGKAEGLSDLVDVLDIAFIRAENKVHTLATSHLDEGKKKALKSAEKMFQLACDDAAPEPEKRLGFKAGMKSLEGIIPVSDVAIDNMKARVGILELEA